MSRATVIRHHRLAAATVFVVLFGLFAPLRAAASGPVQAIRTSRLECDHLVNPLGIDDLHPQLSWRMDSARPGAAQSAYRIKVATTPGMLQGERPDVWDSGRVASSVSVGVSYGGATLVAGRRYYWSVQVWDRDGAAARASEPGWWEMALLKPSGWEAKWISSETEEDRGDFDSNPKWIWTAREDALHHAQPGKHVFRFDFDLKAIPADATLLITAEDNVSAALNGKQVLATPELPPWGPSYRWGTFREVKVTRELQPGRNVLTAEATVAGSGKNGFAGLIALLRLRMPDGTMVRYVSDARWRSLPVAQQDGSAVDSSDQSWRDAAVVAQIGDSPLGTPWGPKPASLFRRDFQVSKAVRSARLYVTALGTYQMRLNGSAVGKDVLAPGWTDYKAKLFYQTYDVTPMLHRGENVIGALLGDGWYGSGLLWSQQRYNFGPPPLRLLAQLNVEYMDGTHEVIGSGSDWQTSRSAIRRSDIYNGEEYDARDEQAGWDNSGFHPAMTWAAATLGEPPPARLVAQNFQPIEVERQLSAKEVTSPSAGVYVFDFGQNMVGSEWLRVAGPRGTTVRLRFGEVLQPNGQLYTENMRTAGETDTYTLRGDGQEVFIPHFTYHGFRYVEVTGYPGKPTADAVAGIVFHTAAPFTVTFASGSAMVNKLWSNILWGQRGNFESIPTDCPQRDERLGWMGDAEVFWRTASYDMDLAAFSEKFASDMRIAQSPQGNFSDITPRVGTAVGDGSPGWADAGVIIPYTAWRQFGDVRIVEESWDSMERYLALLLEQNPDFINHRKAYGDWLAIGSTTPQDFIGTAYWAYDAQLMASMARGLHRDEDARRYDDLFAKLKSAFQQHFVKPDGSVGSESQTSYVLALNMNLLPQEQRPMAADRLVADITAHQYHLTTGFLGTPYIMSVLSNSGHSDIAYKLLLTETYPSWGYMVQRGATTMWERWNGDQMLGDPGMNSFNHYAYGAVGEWLYRYAAGIDLAPGDAVDEAVSGGQAFHHFELHPRFDAALGHADAAYDSEYGVIRSSWRYVNGAVEWLATVPANTSATVTIPASSGDRLLLDGKPVTDHAAGLKSIPSTAGTVRFDAGPGTYRFTVRADLSAQR